MAFKPNEFFDYSCVFHGFSWGISLAKTTNIFMGNFMGLTCSSGYWVSTMSLSGYFRVRSSRFLQYRVEMSIVGVLSSFKSNGK